MKKKTATKKPRSLALPTDARADLIATLAVLHTEGRRRAVLDPVSGGFTNLELIGFTKALATIDVQAASLLETEEAEAD